MSGSIAWNSGGMVMPQASFIAPEIDIEFNQNKTGRGASEESRVFSASMLIERCMWSVPG